MTSHRRPKAQSPHRVDPINKGATGPLVRTASPVASQKVAAAILVGRPIRSCSRASIATRVHSRLRASAVHVRPSKKKIGLVARRRPAAKPEPGPHLRRADQAKRAAHRAAAMVDGSRAAHGVTPNIWKLAAAAQ